MAMDAPFTWFGGKRQAAGMIWDALGDVRTYIEPFLGTAAVLLRRPAGQSPRREIVNDADCMVVNFWRSVQAAPEEVVAAMRVPVYELEIRATNRVLIASREGLAERLRDDLAFCNPAIAGRWCWGQRCWIGGGWADRDATQVPNQQGSQALARDFACDALGESQASLRALMLRLSERLLGVQALCGDWSRCVASNAMLGLDNTGGGGPCGVLLDPPYFDYDGSTGTYAVKDRGQKPVAVLAAEWAKEHGQDARLRIVLCGYEGEHVMPAGWRVKAWKARGGYANRNAKGNSNAARERLWLSPACIHDEDGLFGMGGKT